MDEQRTAEWFAKRCGKLTGSAFNEVMNFTAKGEPGAGRKNLIVKLAVERITRQTVETYQNSAMRRGIELEPIARLAYEAHTGALVDEIDFIDHPLHEFIGVSPDGLIGDDGMVEIKCPDSMHKHLDALAKGSHAAEYKWQLQGQLWVAGRQWNDATSFDPRFPEKLQLAIVRVQRDEEMIARLEAECLAVESSIQHIVTDLTQRIAA